MRENLQESRPPRQRYSFPLFFDVIFDLKSKSNEEQEKKEEDIASAEDTVTADPETSVQEAEKSEKQ